MASLLSEKPSDADYRVLGIRPDADPESVKRAYRTLAKRWHPDRFGQVSAEERRRAEERMQEITGAYRRISGSWKKNAATPRAPSASPGASPGVSSSGTSSGGASRNARGTRTASPGNPKSRTTVFSDVLAAPFRMFKWSHLSSGRSRSFAAALIAAFVLAAAVTYLTPWDWLASSRSEKREPVQRTAPRIPPVTASVNHSHDAVRMPPASVPREAGHTPSPPSMPATAKPFWIPLPHDLPFITLGSQMEDVRRILGRPSRVMGQTWFYGLSEIHFRDGHVWRYVNFEENLKVDIYVETQPEGEPPRFFTLGSTPAEVRWVQGVPSRAEPEKWGYDLSEVYFKNGKVDGFKNDFGTLNVRIVPPPLNPLDLKDYFSIGSPRSDVVALQGTPTTVVGNTWFYGLSRVVFRQEKVESASNADDNLHYLPPEER